MKAMKYMSILFICLIVGACDDDKGSEGDEKKDRSETQAWIENTMQNHYYWNKESPTKLNYGLDVEDFFYSLLSKKDGKPKSDGKHYYYSTIEKIANTRGYIDKDYTYGFEFAPVNFTANGFTAAIVLFVLDDSPAKKAGLKRGDWIRFVNGKNIDNNQLLYGGSSATFGIYKWVKNSLVFDRNIDIDEAIAMDYDPIPYFNTYDINSKKVGYLLYNSFKAGINDIGKEYDDELRRLSTEKFAGVDEFVLDLRYNNGGLLSCVQLMCAILGPSKILSEKEFGYLEYRDGSKKYFPATHSQGNGNNLGLTRLFVLVSASSASASEAVINLLDPWMEVIVIGRTTEGKNVASEPYTSSDKVWEMHPITSMIFNSEGLSDYVNGWVPNYTKGDVFDYEKEGYVTPIETILELGDPEERLLKIAFNLIRGYSPDTRTRSTESSERYTARPSSITRKASGAVIIDIMD